MPLLPKRSVVNIKHHVYTCTRPMHVERYQEATEFQETS